MGKFLRKSKLYVKLMLAVLSGHFYIGTVFSSGDPGLMVKRLIGTEPAGIFPFADVIKTIILAYLNV